MKRIVPEKTARLPARTPLPRMQGVNSGGITATTERARICIPIYAHTHKGTCAGSRQGRVIGLRTAQSLLRKIANEHTTWPEGAQHRRVAARRRHGAARGVAHKGHEGRTARKRPRTACQVLAWHGKKELGPAWK